MLVGGSLDDLAVDLDHGTGGGVIVLGVQHLGVDADLGVVADLVLEFLQALDALDDIHGAVHDAVGADTYRYFDGLQSDHSCLRRFFSPPVAARQKMAVGSGRAEIGCSGCEKGGLVNSLTILFIILCATARNQ